MAHAVAVPIALERDRAVGSDGTDLGFRQWTEPCPARLGIDDHRIRVDPVGAQNEAALIAIVAEAPREEAGIVTTAKPSSHTGGAARKRIPAARTDQIATGTNHGARAENRSSRGWRCPYLHAPRTLFGTRTEQPCRVYRG